MKRQYSFLNDNKNKIDLKNIKKNDAEKIAEEIRNFLVESVEITGGHLASNLGVVEAASSSLVTQTKNRES